MKILIFKHNLENNDKILNKKLSSGTGMKDVIIYIF